MDDLYIVELDTHGWFLAVYHSPESSILTMLYGIPMQYNSKLQTLKVKFYRILSKYALFKINGKYVIHQRKLPNLERDFQRLYQEFILLRDEIFTTMVSKWEEIEKNLQIYADKYGISPFKIRRLKPESTNFLEMSYTVSSLSQMLRHLLAISKQFSNIADSSSEYESIAKRIMDVYKDIVKQLKSTYYNRSEELIDELRKIKEITKRKNTKQYINRMHKIKDEMEEYKAIVDLLGDSQLIEDYNNKIKLMKELLYS